MVKRVSKKPDWQQRIARERIEILLQLAKKEFRKHPERSRRYVELMRKISQRYNVRLDKKIKRSFCKSCNNLLIPGKTARIRLESNKKTVLIKCLKCNKFYRIPYR